MNEQGGIAKALGLHIDTGNPYNPCKVNLVLDRNHIDSDSWSELDRDETTKGW